MSGFDNLDLCRGHFQAFTGAEGQAHLIIAPSFGNHHRRFDLCDFGPDLAGTDRFGNKDHIRCGGGGLRRCFIFGVIKIGDGMPKAFNECFERIVSFYEGIFHCRDEQNIGSEHMSRRQAQHDQQTEQHTQNSLLKHRLSSK